MTEPSDNYFNDVENKINLLISHQSSTKKAYTEKMMECKKLFENIMYHARELFKNVNEWKFIEDDLNKLKNCVEQLNNINEKQSMIIDEFVIIAKNINNKMKEQEKKMNRLEDEINLHKEMIYQQKEIIIQQGRDIKQLVDYKNQISVYSTYRDWATEFKKFIVEKINNSEIVFLTESNTTFHKNQQSIQEARKVLDEIAFPKDMKELKNTLQKTLKVLEDSGLYK
ncbi:5937_t:CDS:2 [Funneliformis geosporum]|uniref:9230_t:CDS:1 n=1 Tax=Funneliformis geosporum TaxID=1117311 RepID=A0A9W4WVH5_9GLOM|nr:9230_t:CDS:2 [Funneliformis geosporum]CAI2177661.1 5937_t:CDS:2 [Funneliformis geosporum]